MICAWAGRLGKICALAQKHPYICTMLITVLQQWGLVLAGASDFARPADQLSLSQNGALMATGLIWTRWCFVIKPRNLFLASVNFLLFCVGATQVSRVLSYQSSLKGDSEMDEAKKELKKDAQGLERIVEDPKAAVKSVTDPK